jgi:hypothetical protein
MASMVRKIFLGASALGLFLALNALSAYYPTVDQGEPAPSASAWPVYVTTLPTPVGVSAASLPLPAGAATSANQTTANSSLSSIDGKLPSPVSGKVPVDGSSVTQPVSAASLPLPAGAATSANQTTANSSLSSIDGKLPSPVSGRVPVDGSSVTQPVSAASLPLPAGAATSANQTSGDQKTKIVDTAGNVVESILAAGVQALPVIPVGIQYFFSTVNSTTAQLSAGATFNGTPEDTKNQPTYSILAVSDQPGTMYVRQYIDSGGTQLTLAETFAVTAGAGFSRSGVVNGNYVKVSFTNTGASATTTLRIDTAYGIIQPATQLNNLPISLAEVNGKVITPQSVDGGSQFLFPTLATMAGTPAYFATATTSTLKSGGGVLKRICLGTNGGNGDTITAYNNTSAAAPIMVLVTTSGGSAPGTCAGYDAKFTTGLTIVTAGTTKWTVVYE